MDMPDILPVEQRLAAIIKEERHEAIGYTILTVLCTPVFVVLGTLAVLILLAYMFQFANYDIDVRGIYTGTNIFLASMIIFVLRCASPAEEPRAFDGTWLAAVVVFILPFTLTYATGLPERFPVLFAVVYAVLGFVVLGLLGNVQIEQPARDEAYRQNAPASLILLVCGFVADAYGEITRRSWLWFPPQPDELRIAAWILCKLSIEKTSPMEARSVSRRVLNMLLRLKLVHEKDRKLQLTLKGHDLVTSGREIQSAVKE